MHNFYSIEVEAEFRRQEWEREAAAEARVGQAAAASQKLGWPHFPPLALPSFRALTAPLAPRSGEC
jgi:hypothetical protein